jgi:hypothetical protein
MSCHACTRWRQWSSPRWCQLCRPRPQPQLLLRLPLLAARMQRRPAGTVRPRRRPQVADRQTDMQAPVKPRACVVGWLVVLGGFFWGGGEGKLAFVSRRQLTPVAHASCLHFMLSSQPLWSCSVF